MELEILGSGTSHGIPVIGCSCPVCTSKDPRDSRLRASALIRTDSGHTILIDAGPEFRIQALRAGIIKIDAVLLTHPHADHIHGLDDLRIFTHERDLPVFGLTECLDEVRERFSYVFRETQIGGGKPHFTLNPVDGEHAEPVVIGSAHCIPIPARHGMLNVLGWRIADTAYLTDCNHLSDESLRMLDGVRNLVIDALRERPHTTHFNFDGALALIAKTGAEFCWFTHICHDFSHRDIQAWIASHPLARTLIGSGKKIEPAHDGLLISIGKS